MSLPAMSLGDWFSVCNRKGGRGEDGLVYTSKGVNSMAESGFGCKSPTVGHFSYTLNTNGPI